jgi:zinc and cadmium transporter
MNLNLDIIASALAASFLVSLSSLSGLFALWMLPDQLMRVVPYLVSLAVSGRDRTICISGLKQPELF